MFQSVRSTAIKFTNFNFLFSSEQSQIAPFMSFFGKARKKKEKEEYQCEINAQKYLRLQKDFANSY